MSGQSLSSAQVKRLAKLTKNWRYQTENDVAKLKEWESNPSAFWDGAFQSRLQLVEHCLKDPDRTGSDDRRPIQRRVTLLILHDMIQEEKLRLSTGPPGQYKQKHLTAAIQNLVDEACPDAPDRLVQRCTDLQRYGERYSRLKRKERILAPFEAPSLKLVTRLMVVIDFLTCHSFERLDVEDIEFEALDEYGRICHDDEYQHYLRLAFEKLYNNCVLGWPVSPTSKRALNDESSSSGTSTKKRRAHNNAIDDSGPASALSAHASILSQFPDSNPLGLAPALFSSQLPEYNPFAESFPSPSQLPDYNPFAGSFPSPSQLPDYNPFAGSFPSPSQLPEYNPFAALFPSPSQLPEYNPFAALFPSQLPEYNPFAALFPSQLPDNNSFASVPVSIPAQFSVHDSPNPTLLPQGDYHLRGSEHSQLQNHNRLAMHRDSTMAVVFPASPQA
ncbi:hypothetical protein BDW59DRAFT_36270 [Aspergillus cavernicola]|uniref:Uncharacterized protein n=1 Tax=Aspergillus cavernicola TaxID=176166 RepID=A0ABR4IP70_9EURO